jgi:aldose sugar dehydrogenase
VAGKIQLYIHEITATQYCMARPLGWLLNFVIAISLIIVNVGHSSAGGTFEKDSNAKLTLDNPELRAELIVEGMDFPTAMSFLGSNDILVLEKEGTIRRITEGKLLKEPLLDLNVSAVGENGLTGIAIANNEQKQIGNSARIFLYFSESSNRDTMDPNGFSRNRLYRYEFMNDQFTKPKLLLDLPIGENVHNGGKIVIGPDKNVYVSVGDTGRYGANMYSKTQNNDEGREPDGTGGILRMTQDGGPIMENATKKLGSEHPLNLYYAYGIRNSFGMDFDPVTGNLWITENGPSFGDEINLVEPGYNSGWNKVQGFWRNEAGEKGEPELNPEDLVDFDGKGKYSVPEFVWNLTVGPTALKFFNSTKLGEEYKNDIFVGDFNNGYIYHFELNENRTELSAANLFKNKLLDIKKDRPKGEIFAQGPGGIMDIQVGPDGYMYVLALLQKGSDCDPDAAGCVVDNNSKIEGAIFRINSTASKSLT